MTLIHRLPKSQSAIVQGETGQLQLLHNAAIPELRPHTVLVKVVAVALNPYDYKLPLYFPSPGTTGGSDFAGTIVAMSPEATEERSDLSLGDLVSGCVYGWNPETPENGSFAQYVRADAQLVFKVGSYKLKDAATFGAAFATLSLALWHSDFLGLTHSPTDPLRNAPSQPIYVFIYGGSTATGTMALQLLKLYLTQPEYLRSGYCTLAACSPRSFELAKSYGADYVFDYSNPDTPSAIRKLTGGALSLVLDCISDHHSIAVCHASTGRLGGRLITLELPPEPRPGEKRRKAVKHFFVDGALDARQSQH
ncbi:chaperonin 10-like protein [Bipolaris maydis]|nr:chaperonin 10-like protein [Bipolaris maydis]KAJ6192006.1 chaperonin 10-like protein [Bipolaris maydis]KAJ6284281.1 chaperonin 10-like protein [Bipolaris maydis]KAJ6284297.1 chaperonin 10-like protein [Bipolaris maydis]